MMDVLPLWVEIVFLCCGAVLAVLIGKPVIRTLRRLRLGQPISEYLAEHKAKEGTPTCGGAIFIIPALLLYAAARLYLTFVKPDAYGAGPAAKLDMVILLAVLNAAIGLADDVLKLRKKRHPELKRFEMDNEGLRRWHKFGLQALAAAAVLALGRLTGALDTTFSFRDVNADLGIWFYPVAFFFILYVINAVNLTDGLDGLAGSVAAVALCVSGAVYCVSGMSLLLFGVGGAVLGFLLFNVYPAKVFMGDFGSLFLGSVLAGFGVFSNRILFVLVLTVPFGLDFASSLIQILFCKITRILLKREEGIHILPIAPLHHTFQHWNWSEPRIVCAFDLFTVLCACGAWFLA